ncbi:DUF4231 domain-containing protein [Geodermatophilus sp. SYSU D00697]
MTTRTPTDALVDAWREQRRWSSTAGRLKKRLARWRTAALALAIAGAVLATLATQVGLGSGVGRGLSVAAAVVLAVVPVIRTAQLGRDRVEAWTRARSVAEGLKEEVYLYLTGTPPYDGAGRDAELARRTFDITDDAEDLAGHTLGRPSDDEPLPPVEDVHSYLSVRVQPQIDRYYTPGAARQQRRLATFRAIEFGLALLGALLGAVAAATRLDAVGAWVAVVTTVGAAITAHVAAARYEHLVITYLSTARQLRARVAQWREGTDHGPAAAARLVRDCEDVISRENESWMAAWSRDDGGRAQTAPAGR